MLKFNPKLYLKNLKNKTAIDVAYDSTIIDIFGDYVNKIRSNLKTINKKRNKAMIDTTGGTGGDSRTMDGLLSDKKQQYSSNDYHESRNTLKETSTMRKSQDNQNYINMLEQQAEECLSQCQNKILRVKNNSKYAIYNQRRKSEEPNFPLNGLSVKGNYNPPIYSSTKKQQLQLNTDRGHY